MDGPAAAKGVAVHRAAEPLAFDGADVVPVNGADKVPRLRLLQPRGPSPLLLVYRVDRTVTKRGVAADTTSDR